MQYAKWSEDIHNMPTQWVIIYIRPRLSTNATKESDLVNPSAGCWSVGIYEVEMHPNSLQSQINLYFISIYLEHSFIFPVVMRLIANRVIGMN